MPEPQPLPTQSQPAPQENDQNLLIKLLMKLMGGSSDVKPVQERQSEYDKVYNEM